MKRWHGTHAFGRIRLADDKRIAFGDAQDAYMAWDGTNLTMVMTSLAALALTDAKLNITSTSITAASPSRQAYWQFTATGTLTGGMTGLEIRSTFNGAASASGQGITGAEIKARHTTDNAYTIGQLRGVVGNADTKNGTTTTAYGLEASIDVSAGGTITTGALIHANLNNSGTVTNSYVLYGEGTSGVYVDYGIYLRYVNRPIYATGNLTGATAKNAVEFAVTDAQTNASGYARGLYIACTASGTKTTSGEHNSLGIDLTVTGNTPYAYIQSLYFAQSGNPTIGLISAISIYIDNIGTAVASLHMLDLQTGNPSASAASTREAYIRCRNHGTGTPTSIFFLQANNNAKAATNFIEQDSVTIGPVAAAVNTGTDYTPTYKVRCLIGSTTFYLTGVAES